MVTEPTVFIVDDDAAVRDSLRWLVESVGLNVEPYATAREFLDVYDSSRPGCLVLDVRMPAMSGLDLQEELAAREPTSPIVFITGYGDVPAAVRAMRKGAVDFIEKPFSDQVLLDRIQRCIELDARNRRDHARGAKILARFAVLTRRERQVMDLVVAGKSNKATARQLGISGKTIETHRAKVMQKMQAKSLADLVRMAAICKTDREKP